MRIVFATDSDYEYIRNRDHHISESLILSKIKENEIYILRSQDESNIGWMRYGYFWDNTPFMNMIVNWPRQAGSCDPSTIRIAAALFFVYT
ncbi:hypothetical protein PRIO_1905 [Paenibacillus riograndensis SBR5]|uniref:Uncharacterized protein n=1 Tax=Paenibacillus riograndensis SBR5 TaxID=1073571 RepID=A0A0E4HC66_9BACL|nr:hypothetical protein PRIO_1905 [Paenibacillus riograndensis SBR5]